MPGLPPPIGAAHVLVCGPDGTSRWEPVGPLDDVVDVEIAQKAARELANRQRIARTLFVNVLQALHDKPVPSVWDRIGEDLDG